jgi:hypothetical protein
VFENRVWRRIFGPKREEVAGGLGRLHNQELHNLYASPNTIKVMKSRRMRWTEHIACMKEIRNAYKIFVRKHVRKRPFRRCSHGWENNIRMYLKK